MNIILDLLVVGIFAGSIIVGFSRGFIRSVMGLLSGILALVLAFVFTPMLAGVVDEHIVHPALSGFVEDRLVSVSPSESPDDGIEEMIDEKPSAFRELLDSFGISVSELENALFGGDKTAETGAATDEAVTGDEAPVTGEKTEKGVVGSLLQNAADVISSKLSGIISSILAFIVVYIVALILLRIITFLLEGLLSVGPLKTSDKILGALFGLVTGAVSCVAICTVVANLLPYLANSDNAFFANITSEKTMLFKYFSDINFIKEFIGGFINH